MKSLAGFITVPFGDRNECSQISLHRLIVLTTGNRSCSCCFKIKLLLLGMGEDDPGVVTLYLKA